MCRKLIKYQVLLVASTQGLVAGGVAGLFWSYVWTYAGMALVVLSLAEMASMAPTSGGQYREFLSLFNEFVRNY
jgi:amino acid permease